MAGIVRKIKYENLPSHNCYIITEYDDGSVMAETAIIHEMGINNFSHFQQLQTTNKAQMWAEIASSLMAIGYTTITDMTPLKFPQGIFQAPGIGYHKIFAPSGRSFIIKPTMMSYVNELNTILFQVFKMTFDVIPNKIPRHTMRHLLSFLGKDIEVMVRKTAAGEYEGSVASAVNYAPTNFLTGPTYSWEHMKDEMTVKIIEAADYIILTLKPTSQHVMHSPAQFGGTAQVAPPPSAQFAQSKLKDYDEDKFDQCVASNIQTLEKIVDDVDMTYACNSKQNTSKTDSVYFLGHKMRFDATYNYSRGEMFLQFKEIAGTYDKQDVIGDMHMLFDEIYKQSKDKVRIWVHDCMQDILQTEGYQLVPKLPAGAGQSAGIAPKMYGNLAAAKPGGSLMEINETQLILEVAGEVADVQDVIWNYKPAGHDGWQSWSNYYEGHQQQIEITGDSVIGYTVAAWVNNSNLNPLGGRRMLWPHQGHVNPNNLSRGQMTGQQESDLVYKKTAKFQQKVDAETWAREELKQMKFAICADKHINVIYNNTMKKSPQYQDTKAQWKAEGRCPNCGELGAFVQFAMTCSQHGPYT